MLRYAVHRYYCLMAARLAGCILPSPLLAAPCRRPLQPFSAGHSRPGTRWQPLIGSSIVGQPNHSHRARCTVATMALAGDVFFLDSFAIRQWDDPNYSGTRISFDKAEFVRRIHEAHAAGAPLVDGYAPFCKHVFVPNFVDAKLGTLEITDGNKHLLQSGYSKRRPEELAVLTRWFPADKVSAPVAGHLDVILYSREQLVQEYADMPVKGQGGELPPAPWGIISIKAQDEDYETPMQPITMMRNALGREEGGSGVPLDRKAYDASVAYWETHAPIVAGQKPNGE